MKTVLVLASVLAVAFAFDYVDKWANFKKSYGKSYSTDLEELSRQEIFESNMKYIEEHNKNAEKHGFTLGVNEFADLSGGEFANIFNGYLAHMKKNSSNVRVPTHGSLPTTVDWRTKGVVTPIKNQGQCGSCWAFSTTGSLEGQHFRKTGNLVSLSEQQLVDCSGKYGNQGCNGGLMDNAFKYIKENGGDDTEASYPYVAHDESCHFNPQTVGANDTGYVDIPSKDESKLQVAVATVGPISCAMDASHISFQFYHSGVYWSLFCSQTKLDHGVLSVGYGSEGSKEYWIMKNSWGTSWGMKGYFNLRRGKNECGVATAASYPTV